MELLEKLKAEKESLEKRIAIVSNLITMMSDPAASNILQSYIGGTGTQTVNGPVTVKEKEKPRRQVNHMGARKNAVLALYTGSMSAKEVARALTWEQSFARAVLSGCVQDKLATVDAAGVNYALTPAGTQYADWFQKNPNATVYRGTPLPNRNSD